MRTILLTVLGFTVASAALGADPRASADIVAVRILNYAAVSDGPITAAAVYAKRVLSQAGVDSEWTIHGPVDIQEKPGRRNLVMRIIPNRMIIAWATQSHHLGYSLLPPEGGPGYIGGVHYERIRDFADSLNIDRTLIFGIVLAHEVGHLLLGAKSHAASGIMSFPMQLEHIRLASHGNLRFTGKQAKAIRDSLRNRLPDGQLAQR